MFTIQYIFLCFLLVEVLQILCVLHVDTIKDVATYSKQLQYLSNLSVEFLKHEEGYTSGRVLYMYRKSSGKIVKKARYFTYSMLKCTDVIYNNNRFIDYYT